MIAMMFDRLSPALALLLLGCASQPATHADDSAPADAGRDASGATVRHAWTVEPGRFAELNVALQRGSRMTAAFSTRGGALDWNVHSHPEHSPPIVHAEGTSSQGEPTFVANEAGTYSFLWQNDTASPIELSVDLALSEGATLVSTHP